MLDHPPRSIAILRLAALGDVVMTVPLVRTLQKAFPSTKLYWIISEPMLAILEGMDGIEFIRIKKPHNIRDYWQIYQQLKPYAFDVLLVPQASLRSNLMIPLIHAQVKYGFGRLHAREGQRCFVHRTVPAYKEHLIDSFLRFAEVLGVQERKVRWDLPIAPKQIAWAKRILSRSNGPWLAISPAASKAERNWPVERYIHTLNQLQMKWPHLNYVLIGGPEPSIKALSSQLAKGLKNPCLNLTGQTSLKELAALLGNVDAILAPDTGPLHIAVAMGTPVIGLYAVASSAKTGPYYQREWTVDRYEDALKTLLKKNPKTVSWRQRVHHPKAMTLISVDEVVEKIDQLLKNRA